MNFESLTEKQTLQLVSLSEEFQPVFSAEGVAFLDYIMAARRCCDKSCSIHLRTFEERFRTMKVEFERISGRYYFIPSAAVGGRPLTKEQREKVVRTIARVRVPAFGGIEQREYSPVEKVLFVRIVRACRDYLRAEDPKRGLYRADGIRRNADCRLFQEISSIYHALR